jgi:tRNA(fMet)-specific endonuclease VapC
VILDTNALSAFVDGDAGVGEVKLKRSGRPIPANDAWIAALALEHGLPILSRDQHFDAVPGVERVSF